MQPVIRRSRFMHQMRVLSPKFPRYLSHSINNPSHAQGPQHDHGTCAAGLPGIYNVDLVSHIKGDGKSLSWWSRGVSKPEKLGSSPCPGQACPAQGLERHRATSRLRAGISTLDFTRLISESSAGSRFNDQFLVECQYRLQLQYL